MTFKTLMFAFALLSLSLPMTASAQQSDFNYLGLRGGMVGGPAIDDTYGGLNGYQSSDTDTNPVSYGVDLFRMVKPGESGVGFGFSVTGGTFTFETEADGETFDYKTNYLGAGILIGDITERAEGQKSTYFVGLEYLKPTVEISSSVAELDELNDWFSDTTNDGGGALSIPFGIYSTFGENGGLSGGIGGRYFMGEPNGFYEIFLSIGVSF